MGACPRFHGSIYRNDLFGTYFSGGQAWFNIPLYMILNPGFHATGGGSARTFWANISPNVH
jgi:hypothetical protein